MNKIKSESKEQVLTSCDKGGPFLVYVKDGRVTRVRPIVLGLDDAESWTINVGTRSFSPPRKAAVAPYTMSFRKRVYSPNRVKQPLLRVGFDSDGDRHPETRGRAKYTAISWDEALSLIASEIKRIKANYGASAILPMHSSHHMWGNVHYHFSVFDRFFRILGHTHTLHNPDSWEGWHWGAAHVFGFHWNLATPNWTDLLEDVMKNSEMIVYWSNDPDTIRLVYSGQESAIWRLWLKELSKKQIFIDPFCNYTAAILADKWIAPRPGTDSALAAAIAYMWITEGTYDREYVATHTFGFDKWVDYVTGREDKVPKTPKWAEEITDVPASVIRALAREWASKRTSLGCFFGSAGRQAYAHEWSRMMVLLQAMQGLGKPGVSLWSGMAGAPQNRDFRMLGYRDTLDTVGEKNSQRPVNQFFYRLFLPDSILNPPVRWMSNGHCFKGIDEHFEPFVYPTAGEPEVRMIYRYGGSYISTMTNTNRWLEAYQSSKIEFMVCQTPWMEPEAIYADIILPSCTSLERNDISEFARCAGWAGNLHDGVNHRIVVFQKKCIEPLYESRSDYDIFVSLAELLGFRNEFDEGNSEEEWIRKVFDVTSLPDYLSYDDFKKKGYFVVPLPGEYQARPAMRQFYDEGSGLSTMSGKIEFFAQSLHQNLPDDTERTPVPHYIPSWEGYSSQLAEKYPLQLISPHPRFSFHTQFENVPWIREIQRIHKNGIDWWPIRINPQDASKRGVKHLDVVRVYNDRATILCIAVVTERVRPGTVHSYEAAWYDPMEPGKVGSLDRGGAVNLLSPDRPLSKNAPGQANNSCLVEIAKWEEY